MYDIKKKRKYSILTQKRKTIQYSVVKTNERAKNIWYYYCGNLT